MMKALIFFMLFVYVFGYAQDNPSIEAISDSLVLQLEAQEKAANYFPDTIYAKDLNYDERRELPANLKDKYDGAKFKYVDDLEKPKKEVKVSKTSKSMANGFAYFMANIFPFLLAIIVILILLRSFVDIDLRFGRFGKAEKNTVEKLNAEEDNIYEADLKKLLQKAISDKNYRLATRYYYLSLLKLLSEKELIQYDKDKTNSEYLFELKDTNMRSHFSYLSYVYNYVWYGEFLIDKDKFDIIEEKYQSFIKTVN